MLAGCMRQLRDRKARPCRGLDAFGRVHVADGAHAFTHPCHAALAERWIHRQRIAALQRHGGGERRGELLPLAAVNGASARKSEPNIVLSRAVAEAARWRLSAPVALRCVASVARRRAASAASARDCTIKAAPSAAASASGAIGTDTR